MKWTKELPIQEGCFWCSYIIPPNKHPDTTIGHVVMTPHKKWSVTLESTETTYPIDSDIFVEWSDIPVEFPEVAPEQQVLTAYEAYEIATQKTKKIFQEESLSILKDIALAASEGRMCLEVPDPVSPNTLSTLKNMGYEVRYFMNKATYELPSLSGIIISWDDKKATIISMRGK
jgi:hypothetical protein